MKTYSILFIILFSSLRIFSQFNPDDVYWNSDFGAPANDVIKALIAGENDIYWSEFGRMNYYNFNDILIFYRYHKINLYNPNLL